MSLPVASLLLSLCAALAAAVTPNTAGDADFYAWEALAAVSETAVDVGTSSTQITGLARPAISVNTVSVRPGSAETVFLGGHLPHSTYSQNFGTRVSIRMAWSVVSGSGAVQSTVTELTALTIKPTTESANPSEYSTCEPSASELQSSSVYASQWVSSASTDVIIAGGTSYAIFSTPHPNENTRALPFVARIDGTSSSGSASWARIFDSTAGTTAASVLVDSSNDAVYVAGYVRDNSASPSFNGVTHTRFRGSFWVARVTLSDGTDEWTKVLITQQNNVPETVCFGSFAVGYDNNYATAQRLATPRPALFSSHGSLTVVNAYGQAVGESKTPGSTESGSFQDKVVFYLNKATGVVAGPPTTWCELFGFSSSCTGTVALQGLTTNFSHIAGVAQCSDDDFVFVGTRGVTAFETGESVVARLTSNFSTIAASNSIQLSTTGPEAFFGVACAGEHVYAVGTALSTTADETAFFYFANMTRESLHIKNVRVSGDPATTYDTPLLVSAFAVQPHSDGGGAYVGLGVVGTLTSAIRTSSSLRSAMASVSVRNTYWNTTNFGSCSVDCGPGVQTRASDCYTWEDTERPVAAAVGACASSRAGDTVSTKEVSCDIDDSPSCTDYFTRQSDVLVVVVVIIALCMAGGVVVLFARRYCCKGRVQHHDGNGGGGERRKGGLKGVWPVMLALLATFDVATDITFLNEVQSANCPGRTFEPLGSSGDDSGSFCYLSPQVGLYESTSSGSGVTTTECGGAIQAACLSPTALASLHPSCQFSAIRMSVPSTANSFYASSVIRATPTNEIVPASDIELVVPLHSPDFCFGEYTEEGARQSSTTSNLADLFAQCRCEYRRKGSQKFAIISRVEKDPAVSTDAVQKYATAMLVIIGIKELLKALFVLTLPFASTFREPGRFKYVRNSPLMLPFFLFSRLYRELGDLTFEISETWALAFDTFFEDLPQIVLPVLIGQVNGQLSTIAIVSLCASLVVVSVNILRFMYGFQRDIKVEKKVLETELEKWKRQYLHRQKTGTVFGGDGDDVEMKHLASSDEFVLRAEFEAARQQIQWNSDSVHAINVRVGLQPLPAPASAQDQPPHSSSSPGQSPLATAPQPGAPQPALFQAGPPDANPTQYGQMVHHTQ